MCVCVIITRSGKANTFLFQLALNYRSNIIHGEELSSNPVAFSVCTVRTYPDVVIATHIYHEIVCGSEIGCVDIAENIQRGQNGR